MTALAPVLPPIVVDVAAVLDAHQRNARECTCLRWDYQEMDHTEHQAVELAVARLISYTQTGRRP